MRNDGSPVFCLFVAVIAGVIAGTRGGSGGAYGAVTGMVFFLLWDLGLQPFATNALAAAAIGMLAINAVMQGAIWGGLWGAAGGWLGRKMSGKTAEKPSSH